MSQLPLPSASKFFKPNQSYISLLSRFSSAHKHEDSSTSVGDDTTTWKSFLAPDIQASSTDYYGDVAKAIEAGQFLKLSPDCLWHMLHAKLINIDEFGNGLLDNLQKKYPDDNAVHTIDQFYRHMQETHKYGLNSSNFNVLNIEQQVELTCCTNSCYIFFALCGLLPQDFAMLNPDQISAVTGCAHTLFVDYRFKPKDIAPFKPEQIQAITSNARELFSVARLQIDTLIGKNPEEIDAWASSIKKQHEKEEVLTDDDIRTFTEALNTKTLGQGTEWDEAGL